MNMRVENEADSLNSAQDTRWRADLGTLLALSWLERIYLGLTNRFGEQ